MRQAYFGPVLCGKIDSRAGCQSGESVIKGALPPHRQWHPSTASGRTGEREMGPVKTTEKPPDTSGLCGPKEL